MFNKRKTKLNGFNLLELMIVIAIIGVMSVVGIVSLNNSRYFSKLKSAQEEVSATLKTAQNYALQGKAQSSEVCGYGFHFIPNQRYEIFYNKLNSTNKDCQTQNTNPAYLHHRGDSVVSDGPFQLPKGTILKSPAISNTELFFSIPRANVFNRNGAPFSTPIILQFESPSGSNRTKGLTISGRASIKAN